MEVSLRRISVNIDSVCLVRRDDFDRCSALGLRVTPERRDTLSLIEEAIFMRACGPDRDVSNTLLQGNFFLPALVCAQNAMNINTKRSHSLSATTIYWSAPFS
jgi:hypothetical protein